MTREPPARSMATGAAGSSRLAQEESVSTTNTSRMGVALVALAIGLTPLGAGAEEPRATAELATAQGAAAGAVSLAPVAGGIRLTGRVQGLAPGQHGIHVHAVGRCEGPDFASAGGHFNPAGRKHGLKSPEGHHAGDLPNLVVGPDGVGTIDAVADGATLDGAATLLDADGSSVVVHAGPDDELTDPAGNSGGRVACGVVRVAAVSPAQLPRTGGWSASLLLSGALGLIGLGALRRR